MGQPDAKPALWTLGPAPLSTTAANGAQCDSEAHGIMTVLQTCKQASPMTQVWIRHRSDLTFTKALDMQLEQLSIDNAHIGKPNWEA